MRTVTIGEIVASRKPEFVARGYKGRHFFPHRVLHLPKCGPDGFKLAQWMCQEQDPTVQSEFILYADPEWAERFPGDLWFDSDLIWHEQQFGLPGQVATANLRAADKELYSMVLISDLVQRISRRPAEKSRIENRFKGWPDMLLNAILVYASENGFDRLFVPTSDWAMKHTDPNRTVQPEMFSRIYDRPVMRFAPERFGNWWTIDTNRSKNLLIVPGLTSLPIGKLEGIGICHDTEKGLGHVDVDPEFAGLANETSRADTEHMAAIESRLGLATTYNIVGCLMDEVRPVVESFDHEVAFHSYNHVIGEDQLARCREVDYRIKGYRPPQSRITGELGDDALCFHNFEWLASSGHSLGLSTPAVENCLVKIPVHVDDWTMYSDKLPYERWEGQVIRQMAESAFFVLSLHDCYARFWLAHYEQFLSRIMDMGTVMTLSEVANQTLLANALNPPGYGAWNNGH